MIDRWVRGPLPVLGSIIGAMTGGSILNVQQFLTPGNFNWTKPASGTIVTVICIGGGGGGGSGRRGAAGSLRGGGGGAGGGGVSIGMFLMSSLPATVPLTVGAGNAGGVAVAADNTDGNLGITGGTSVWSTPVATSLLSAAGGARGSGGTAAAGGGSGNGGDGGDKGGAGAAGGTGGGSGGAAVTPTTTTQDSYTGGGGGGGGISAANVDDTGGIGALVKAQNASRFSPAGGIIPGSAGESPSFGTVTMLGITAGGGGGGASGGAGAGGAGGNGALGCGGGGGGASVNGQISGKGGNGGDGAIIVITQ